MSGSKPEALPHRYPFRLVDALAAGPEGRSAVVVLSAGDFFGGSGPWPLTLVVEALAQSILQLHGDGAPVRRVRLVAVHAARLLAPLGAGDRLEVEAEETATFGPMRRFSCRAVRGGALVATAEITVAG